MVGNNGDDAADQTRTVTPKSNHFWATMVYVSLVAALAAAVCAACSVRLWAMFIGWNCFSLGAGSAKRGAAAFVCLLGGIALGMGSVVAIASLTPLAGVITLPIIVFILVAITMLSLRIPPFNYVPGYFLGMTAYYASGLAAGTRALIAIGSAALIGAVAGWLLIIGPELVKTRTGTGNPKTVRILRG